MESIRVSQTKGKGEHTALTELLGLPDFEVIGYEIYEPEHQLVLIGVSGFFQWNFPLCKNFTNPFQLVYVRGVICPGSSFGSYQNCTYRLQFGNMMT